MLTTEQKAWQLHENGVEFAELAIICQLERWDEHFNPNGPLTFTMDEAVEKKWDACFKNAHR